MSNNSAAMREALEAARDLLLPQCNGGTAFAKACGETVNKIMDALKKERTSDCNAAAMRDALLKLDKWLYIGSDGFVHGLHDKTGEIERTIKAALALPPRNCDVGTAEEQYSRFNKYCNSQHKKDKPFPCGRAGMAINHCAKCYSIWAQMPYLNE